MPPIRNRDNYWRNQAARAGINLPFGANAIDLVRDIVGDEFDAGKTSEFEGGDEGEEETPPSTTTQNPCQRLAQIRQNFTASGQLLLQGGLSITAYSALWRVPLSFLGQTLP